MLGKLGPTMKKLILLLLLLSAPTWAHDFWLKPDGGGVVMIYGEAGESEPYKADMIKSVMGWATGGAKRDVKKSFANDQLKLVGKGVSAWTVEVDNGYWTKTETGWKNIGKKQQPDALKATWDRHFAKMVTVKNPDLVTGQALEIVLSKATPSLLEGKVLLRGKPAPGLDLELNHEKVGKTDADGKFSFTTAGTGLVLLAAHHQEKLEGNPEADFLNLESALTIKL